MIQHPFYDRIHEMTFLNKQYEEENSSFIILYGRRRVGKTELLRQFLKEKNGIFFLATESSSQENIKDFSAQCEVFLQDNSFHLIPFNSWESIFSTLIHHNNFGKLDPNHKTIIIFDEFPYLIQADSSIPSVFQKIWDIQLSGLPVMFILCGSSVSIMESNVLGYKSPLYGRRTGQWKVNPLSFQYLHNFLPWEPADLVRTYSVVGGIPAYVQKFDKSISFWDNISNNILEKGSFLYNEAEILLNYEFRQPANYITLLRAIASGKGTMGEICNATGMDKGMVSKYLHTLLSLHILKDELPVTSHAGARGKKYRIIDPYLLFWFRYIYPNRTDLEFLRIEEVCESIKQTFDHHCGQCFEFLVRELILERMILPDFSLEKIGRWWFKDIEIDIVGIDENTKSIVFCEVKWSDLNHSDVKKIYNKLKDRASHVLWQNEIRKETYCIVGRDISNIESFNVDNIRVYDLKTIFQKLI